jgi:tetratricopeptide (TPR) repeat protein
VAAAVLGQGCSFELLAQVAELGEHEALPALDEALRGSLLRETGGTYLFAHDKIRDVVYTDAGEARRRVFHRRALESLQADDWSAAELAHHALVAGLDRPAFELSVAAGDEAMRLLAARDAVEHYARAREIAQRRGWTEHLANLHLRVGKAFASVAQWVEARGELEVALEGIGADQPDLRGEVLVDLLEVCWWSMDLPTLRRRAAELRVLGENLGRADLQTAALSWQAPTVAADGDLCGSIALSELALARSQELGFPPPAMTHAYFSLPYYWLGRIDEAVERSREGLHAARDANHTSATLHALPHLGLSLAASGRYDEAAVVFDEARRLGREYGIGTMLARAIAMPAGYHLDLFDFAVNEALAEEARELARSLNFPPPAISAGIDLILNYARRHEVGRAEKLIAEVAETADKATGWHGWLWGLRLAQARAEIALERRDWDSALYRSTQAIDQCRLRGRIKYEAMGLTTRARAQAAVGRTSDALADAEDAVGLARRMGDPAFFLRSADVLLAFRGTEALAAEAQSAAQRILLALTDDTLRRSFETADPVRAVLRVAR